MEEHDVVPGVRQLQGVDVLDAVVEAVGEVRLLGGEPRLADRLLGKVDPFHPVADPLREDVALEEARAAPDREPEREGRTRVRFRRTTPSATDWGRPVTRRLIVAPDERLGAPVVVLGLARALGAPEPPGGGGLRAFLAEGGPAAHERARETLGVERAWIAQMIRDRGGGNGSPRAGFAAALPTLLDSPVLRTSGRRALSQSGTMAGIEKPPRASGR